jgi:hypothetical protein
MVEEPMAIDESVSAVDTPVRVDLKVCKVGFFVLNTQIDDKVDGIVAVHESVSKVEVPVIVNGSVCIVNDTLTGYESAYKVESSEAVEEREFKIGLPVAVDESACNVKDTVAISQSVCMVECHVDVDQSVCKPQAIAVVDACTDIGKAKSQEDALEECSMEMVLEVSSDVDYDCNVYEEDKPVAYAYERFLTTATKYHRQLQCSVRQTLKKYELTAALATKELVWFMASALLALLVFGILMAYSSIFSSGKKAREPSRNNHTGNAHKKHKFKHMDK